MGRVIFGVVKWFVVGVLAGVTIFLTALTIFLLGITLPFVVLSGWLTVRLARQPDELSGASGRLIRALSVLGGVVTMATLLGSIKIR
jgi:hypothetical protein